jgi:16S rRNA processing protein RimM
MIYRTGILLGHIKKIHGHDGSVIVRLEKIFTEDIPEMESVFLEIDGKPVPFFIAESEYAGGDNLKIRFKGYNTYEKICEFTGCKVFLNTGGEEREEKNSYTNLTGFKVELDDNSLAGTVTEIIKNPGQWLICLSTEKGRELMIPFHEDLIIKIDRKMKIIQMDLPEGLTEIN